LRQDPDKGYNFEYDVANLEWLRNSIKERVDKKTGKNIPIKLRENRATYRYYGYNKDLVNKLAKYQNNPQLIREASRNQQNTWLSAKFDAKATIRASELQGDGIIIPFKNDDNAKLTMDLLAKFGIKSKLEKTKSNNPRLVIKGGVNYRNIRNRLRMENEKKIGKLDKLIERDEQIKEKDKAQERQECGREFENFMYEFFKLLNPNSKIERHPRLKPGDKHSPIPDFRITEPKNEHGKLQETKLNSKNIRQKDKNYSKVAPVTIWYLEGKEKESKPKGKSNDKNESGNRIRYYNGKTIERILEKEKEKSKNQNRKNAIDKLKEKFKKIKNRAEKAREKLKSHIEKCGKIKSAPRETENGNNNEGAPHKDEEEGGGGGKEENPYKANEQYQQGDQRTAGKAAPKSKEK